MTWKNVPTRTITAGGVQFAYRELGVEHPGTPIVCLIHLAAVLDNWDPRVVDGLATKHRVIAFDNRGVGASSGVPAASMEEMASDAIAFIKAMGLEQVDLFGFSMGGMIAQEIVLMEPQLVRRMILTGTGPAGGEGIGQVARVTYLDMIRGWLTFQDPKQFLFFTRTPAGIRAGKEFLQRLKERSDNRDKEITVAALQAQLKALRRWGAKKPADLSKIHHAAPRRQRRQRSHGPEQEHARSGAPPAEQRTHHLSRFRTRRGIPIPCRLRAQGARVPFAPINVISTPERHLLAQ